jgi:hypothetical protein
MDEAPHSNAEIMSPPSSMKARPPVPPKRLSIPVLPAVAPAPHAASLNAPENSQIVLKELGSDNIINPTDSINNPAPSNDGTVTAPPFEKLPSSDADSTTSTSTTTNTASVDAMAPSADVHNEASAPRPAPPPRKTPRTVFTKQASGQQLVPPTVAAKTEVTEQAQSLSAELISSSASLEQTAEQQPVSAVFSNLKIARQDRPKSAQDTSTTEGTTQPETDTPARPVTIAGSDVAPEDHESVATSLAASRLGTLHYVPQ